MNQLEKTYANFIESVCKMYNVPDAAAPLVKGYEALLEAQNSVLMEGFGLDSIKQTGRKVIDFCKGVGLIGVALAVPFLPITLYNYGQELYDHYKTDKEFSAKMAELNAELKAMNNVEIKVPKNIAREAHGYGSTLLDALYKTTTEHALMSDCIMIDSEPHQNACFAAKQAVFAQQQLADDTKSALITITKCLKKTDSDKSYQCKQDALDEIDDAINHIRDDNQRLKNTLVTYANEWAKATKLNVQEGLASDAAGDMVDLKMNGSREDLPEWKADVKSTCDTIPYGPGHSKKWGDCYDKLWK